MQVLLQLNVTNVEFKKTLRNFYLENPNPLTKDKLPKFEVQIYNTPTPGEAIVLPCSDDYHLYNGDGLDAKSLTDGQNAMIYASIEITDVLFLALMMQFAQMCRLSV